jgi:hypothetical protein
MVTRRAQKMLGFMHNNIEQKVETLEDARRFLRRVGRDLSETERLFLSLALQSRNQLREFRSTLKK